MMWEFEGRSHRDLLVIYRVDEEFSGLSNLSNEFPLRVEDLRIGSSEALYQACRYPHRPEWQREILEAPHTMRAKIMARKTTAETDGPPRQSRQEQSREDWTDVRLTMMRWVLRVKLAHHLVRFGGLLRWSADQTIVERSRSDRFWGAVLGQDGVLRGENWLGRLLMELRTEFVPRWLAGDAERFRCAAPPAAVPDFRLLGREIGEVSGPARAYFYGFPLTPRIGCVPGPQMAI